MYSSFCSSACIFLTSPLSTPPPLFCFSFFFYCFLSSSNVLSVTSIIQPLSCPALQFSFLCLDISFSPFIFLFSPPVLPFLDLLRPTPFPLSRLPPPSAYFMFFFFLLLLLLLLIHLFFSSSPSCNSSSSLSTSSSCSFHRPPPLPPAGYFLFSFFLLLAFLLPSLFFSNSSSNFSLSFFTSSSCSFHRPPFPPPIDLHRSAGPEESLDS